MRIARGAHADQVDQSGVAYIRHPAHVAANVQTDEQKAVAWLHDVLEDTEWTADDLLREGVCRQVVDAVCAMTHRGNEDYFDYVRRVAANPLAREVKKADLIHNMDLSRLPVVTEKDLARRRKYERAFSILCQ